MKIVLVHYDNAIMNADKIFSFLREKIKFKYFAAAQHFKSKKSSAKKFLSYLLDEIGFLFAIFCNYLLTVNA